MRLTLLAAVLGALTFFTVQADAGHRHSRRCGHLGRGVAVSVVTPWGGGAYVSRPRYRERGRYYDDRYYDRRYRKEQRKRAKRRARAYRRGAYCPRY